MKTDKFFPMGINRLWNWILEEYKTGSIFGINKDLFFKPERSENLRISRYGRTLDTPIGLAAGPHTQMAQNIISGWLMGARYIELKTVQHLDDIEVSKPCIDMREEGYNCEWSQELNIRESYLEYLKAWIIIHLLKDKFRWNKKDHGFIFNMSAGYDLKGIKGDKVQGFLKSMQNCSVEKEVMLQKLVKIYPEVYEVDIPDKISDNITLSTMHGTPSDEIEIIGRFLLEESGLHTTLKLNPTLLGPEMIREILNDRLEYDITVPDSAFEHDIKYDEALNIVKNLGKVASERGRFFGLKLTNTLECLNKKGYLPSKEKMSYLSGNVIHPISVNIAKQFRTDLDGDIDISFSAGADAFNIKNLIASNLIPVTVCSDILKPGGYGRLKQYLDNLNDEIIKTGSENIDEFITKYRGTGNRDKGKSAFDNLSDYGDRVTDEPGLKRSGFRERDTKTSTTLGLFDCIKAPCITSCSTGQRVPDYLYYTAKGEFRKAFDVVMDTNPFPTLTGMVCDHKCQTKCTRTNYDTPLKIKEIKRFLAEKFSKENTNQEAGSRKNVKVSVIGAGPAGITCSYYLAGSGVDVEVYERDSEPGGMASGVIPPFRLPDGSVATDINRISSAGFNIFYNTEIDKNKFEELRGKSDFIFVASGAHSNVKLEIEGIENEGVIDPLLFLSEIRKKRKFELGEKIAVIGGGNTAMDTARTALRVAGKEGSVTILYRRTKKEMPADPEEIRAAMEEGIKIEELTAPQKIIVKDGKVSGLICFRTKLSDVDKSGRKYPVKIEGSEKELNFDTVIPAVGQKPDLGFSGIESNRFKRIHNLLSFENILVGGDAGTGSSTVVNAVGDGREAAEIILQESGLKKEVKPEKSGTKARFSELNIKRAIRIKGKPIKEKEAASRLDFNLISETFTEEEAITEASRCLYCDELCNVCVTVCPNRANVPYKGKKVDHRIPLLIVSGGKIVEAGKENFAITQEYQVLNITDLCNQCGNCTSFCPTAGVPFLDKPRISLTKESFNDENKVFFPYFEKGLKKINYKDNEIVTSFFKDNGKLYYSSEKFDIVLEEDTLKILETDLKSSSSGELDLRICFSMKYLLESIPDFLYEKTINSKIE